MTIKERLNKIREERANYKAWKDLYKNAKKWEDMSLWEKIEVWFIAISAIAGVVIAYTAVVYGICYLGVEACSWCYNKVIAYKNRKAAVEDLEEDEELEDFLNM